MIDANALIDALRNKLQITIDYQKKTSGEVVRHTGGLYEIRDDSFWLWDTERNDTIRRFYAENVLNLEVLSIPFMPPHPEWPLKLNGEIII